MNKSAHTINKDVLSSAAKWATMFPQCEVEVVMRTRLIAAEDRIDHWWEFHVSDDGHTVSRKVSMQELKQFGPDLSELVLSTLRDLMNASFLGVLPKVGNPRWPYFTTRCEKCGWSGSSEACITHESQGGDSEVYCPRCKQVFMCDEIEDFDGEGLKSDDESPKKE